MAELEVCTRCGCPIQPGTALGDIGFSEPSQAYREIHANHSECMVALRRKEVEGLGKIVYIPAERA